MRPVLLIRGSGNERDAEALASLMIPTVSESFTEITQGEKVVADQLLDLLASFEGWLILTSRNGLEFWNKLIYPRTLTHVFASNPKLKFAAIGAGTADALKSLGVSEILIPLKQSSEGLLELLSTYPSSTAIMPLGNLAKNVLPEGLRRTGWEIHTGVVYVNSPVAVAPLAATGIERGEFSLVIVRSPSAARALAHFVPTARIPLVCGDSSTAETARELGLNVVGCADDPSPESIANLVARTLEE
jgi:hydroxymethylbilane synthase